MSEHLDIGRCWRIDPGDVEGSVAAEVSDAKLVASGLEGLLGHNLKPEIAALIGRARNLILRHCDLMEWMLSAGEPTRRRRHKQGGRQ